MMKTIVVIITVFDVKILSFCVLMMLCRRRNLYDENHCAFIAVFDVNNAGHSMCTLIGILWKFMTMFDMVIYWKAL